MVILAVLRARDDAYGVAIAREIEETGGRPVTHAAVYLALDRLTQHGLVTSRLGDPTNVADGRRAVHRHPGRLAAIRRTRRAFMALWKGFPN
jgi:DNA-binding PadR family transcriptional regulator